VIACTAGALDRVDCGTVPNVPNVPIVPIVPDALGDLKDVN
jgi:hypothetical protein